MVKKTNVPLLSVLREQPYDYADSYQADFYDKTSSIGPTEAGKAFFTSGPEWVEKLFAFRNRIVSKLGLKTSGSTLDRQQQLEKFRCEPGEQLGLFKVFEKNTQEVILGENDKHLNFRISLFIVQHPTAEHKKTLIVSTTVNFNNWFGRLYFLPVKPLHRFIVPAMIKGMIKRLEGK